MARESALTEINAKESPVIGLGIVQIVKLL